MTFEEFKERMARCDAYLVTYSDDRENLGFKYYGAHANKLREDFPQYYKEYVLGRLADDSPDNVTFFESRHVADIIGDQRTIVAKVETMLARERKELDRIEKIKQAAELQAEIDRQSSE